MKNENFKTTSHRVLKQYLPGNFYSSALNLWTDARNISNLYLMPSGIDDRRRLSSLRQSYQGERCIIVGNGPSLNRMDLSVLRDQHTFGLNRIYLMYEQLGFPMSFLVCMNRFVLEQSGSELARTPGTRFFGSIGQQFIPKSPDTIFLRSTTRPHFSIRPDHSGVWEGGTVTFVAMQLAYFMGFKEVILIGVDHHFRTTGPANQLVTSSGDDPNHFHKGYFGAGYKWQLPDLSMSEIGYEMARSQFESDGRKILDATVDGHLNIFPKVDLSEALKAQL